MHLLLRALVSRVLVPLTCAAAPEAALPALPQAERGQELGEERLVDHDLRFTLTRPDDGWVLMGEEEIRALIPDACAGMRTRSAPPVFCALVVEPALGLDLDATVDLLEATLDLEDLRALSREELDLQGAPARLCLSSGKGAGVPMRFQRLVTVRDGTLYNFVSFGPLTQVRNGRLFTAARGALSFDGGEVRLRSKPATLEDAHGVGWRLERGRFRSAVFGYALEAAPGWCIVHGDELDQLDPDADVGISTLDDQVHAVLVVSSAGAEAPTLAQQARERTREGEQDRYQDTRGMQALGATRQFDVYAANDETPFAYVHGAWGEHGTCYEVHAWCAGGVQERALAALPEALARLSPIGADEVEALGRELARLPDLQNAVGPDFALRRGTFTDFAHGFRWRSPRRGFWQMEIDREALRGSGDLGLTIQELRSGVTVGVIPDTFADAEVEGPAEYHEWALSAVVGEFTLLELGATEEISMGATTALRTRGALFGGELNWAFAAVTVPYGERVLQLNAVVLLRNREAAEAAVDDALRALELLEDAAPVVSRPGFHEDRRLGFRLEGLPGDARVRDATPQDDRATGTHLEIDGVLPCLTVSATTPDVASLDEDFLLQMVREAGREHLGLLARAKPEESRAELSGQVCRRLLWKGLAVDTEALVLQRDRTFYVLVMQGEERERARAAALFSLID